MTTRGEDPRGQSSRVSLGPNTHIDEWHQAAVDYLDGRLSSEDKAAVEQHLASCDDCAARMAAQQGVITLLQGTVHDEAPEDLEDRVLGELLFPSGPNARPAFRGIAVERDSRRPSLLRRLRPWIPVTGMVAAVLVGVVLYGVFRQGSEPIVADQEAATTRAVAEATDGGAGNLSSASPKTMTTAAAGATTTVGMMSTETTSTPPGNIAPASAPEEIRDSKAMVEALEAAGDAVYLAFEALPASDSATEATAEPVTTVPESGEAASKAVPTEAAGQVTDQITAFTELQQLSDSLSMGGPTFAAFVSRKQLQPFLDLLFSIKASCAVDLVLRMEPNADQAGDAVEIAEHKAEFPVIVGRVIPQPAVNRYGFTTSTLIAAGADTAGISPPDEDGTHVLIVIYVRR